MLGVSPAISPWRRETRMNISWHDPELYYFLTLLAGIAALLASLYEFSRPGRRKRAKPLDVVDQPQIKPLPRAVPLDRGQQDFGPAAAQRDRSLPTEEKHVREKSTRAPAQRASKRPTIQSALRERQGPPAEGASKPHG